MIICKQVDVHIQSHNIVIIYHVLQFLNCSWQNFCNLRIESGAWKNTIGSRLAFFELLELGITFCISPSVPQITQGPQIAQGPQIQSEILIFEQATGIFNDSFPGIICHYEIATPIAVQMLVAINSDTWITPSMWSTKSWNSLAFVNSNIWSADSTLNKSPAVLTTSSTTRQTATLPYSHHTSHFHHRWH